jgi:hypothetical protein
MLHPLVRAIAKEPAEAPLNTLNSSYVIWINII